MSTNHLAATIVGLRARVNVTDADLEAMAMARHELVREALADAQEIPPWENLADEHRAFERITIVYSLAAVFQAGFDVVERSCIAETPEKTEEKPGEVLP